MVPIDVNRGLVVFVACGVWFVAAASSRQAAAADVPTPAPEATAVSTVAPGVPPPPSVPPPPYSLPWQLRPVAAVTAIRSDSSVAFYDDATGASGQTVVTLLTGSYKVTPHLAPLVKLGFVQ